MAKSKKEIDAQNYKRLKKSGWLRITFKLWKDADRAVIQKAVDAENNRHIDAIARSHADKEGLGK